MVGEARLINGFANPAERPGRRSCVVPDRGVPCTSHGDDDHGTRARPRRSSRAGRAPRIGASDRVADADGRGLYTRSLFRFDRRLLDAIDVGLNLLAAVDASLKRLGTDSVDLFQVHLWSDTVPLEETLSALDLIQSSGRAAYVEP